MTDVFSSVKAFLKSEAHLSICNNDNNYMTNSNTRIVILSSKQSKTIRDVIDFGIVCNSAKKDYKSHKLHMHTISFFAVKVLTLMVFVSFYNYIIIRKPVCLTLKFFS